MRSLQRSAFFYGVGRTLAILPRSRGVPTVSASPAQVHEAAMQRVLNRYGIDYSRGMMWGDLPSPEVLRAVVAARQASGTSVGFLEEIKEEEARVGTELEEVPGFALKGKTVGMFAAASITLASLLLILFDQVVIGVSLYVLALAGLVASAVYGELTYAQRLKDQDFSLLE